MKIYTRRGDRGDTRLTGGESVRKCSARVEAYGAVDELNSQLGVARAYATDKELIKLIETLQAELFDLGADLATPPQPERREHRIPRIRDEHVRRLEDFIDRLDAELPPLTNFILPGGHEVAAHLHVARGICRRAERCTVAAVDGGEIVSPAALAYLNRLSDLLFVMARWANQRAGVPEIPWNPSPRDR